MRAVSVPTRDKPWRGACSAAATLRGRVGGANELATAAEAAGLPPAGLLETLLGDLLLAAPGGIIYSLTHFTIRVTCCIIQYIEIKNNHLSTFYSSGKGGGFYEGSHFFISA